MFWGRRPDTGPGKNVVMVRAGQWDSVALSGSLELRDGGSETTSSPGGDILRGLRGQAQWVPALSNRDPFPSGAQLCWGLTAINTLPGTCLPQG